MNMFPLFHSVPVVLNVYEITGCEREKSKERSRERRGSERVGVIGGISSSFLYKQFQYLPVLVP